uniref:Oxysterol-binding protein n=1 Tax=Neogobius melanostomus TaxID=47308 RepID=A0A8C6WL24_9GOBI
DLFLLLFVQDFDKKLAEADAYLQILIDQLKLFDEKIKDCKEDESRRVGIGSTSMVESIKHCIVLLQIAKSTINPVDGIYQPSLDAPVVNTMPTQATLPSDASQVCKSDQRPSTLPVGPVVTVMGSLQTPTPNSTGSGPSVPSSGVTSPAHIPLPSHSVPDFSYSSSEDEFYDADEFYQSSTSPKHRIDPSGPTAASPNTNEDTALKRPNTTESLNSSMSNGTTDADQFDSHDDDGEGESVEEHKSVIMHLLSQVRLGMDLTKVVLPTFILERRSLLEMYADFFAHPDLFVSIAEQPEARERMVQVVKWYLSAFHAGRKGSVAKKPYNPILGEVFYCHWDLPSDSEEIPTQMETVSDGPVPWASSNSVCFVAEQVSHHPPISAFYAECLNRKIQFNAHIWTKSKFLGMSIGVHNIGQGMYQVCIFHLNFPYLGGECNISCSKTGYSANIVFHTKPFYGGKKHRITAEILAPNDKKSFCSIEGEWNGVMYAKSATGVSFKISLNLNQGDVTQNLKLKDIDAATDAKHSLEEKQRAEARERKENEQQWETRLFHEDGECWVYDEPLLKRVTNQRN